MQSYKPSNLFRFITEKMQSFYPKYIGLEWTETDLPDITVYPSLSMIEQYQNEIKKTLPDEWKE